jgi:uncharacterized lipoprotein YajG
MKKLVVLCALALLTGCASAPQPITQSAARPVLGAGDSLGKDLHRTDSAISDANARERAFAAHPEN